MPDLGPFDRAAGAERLGRVAELLERSGIPLEEIARVDKVRVGEHEVAVKVRQDDGTDRIEVIRQAADSLVLTPVWQAGPAWPVVAPAAPVRVAATKATPADDCITAVVLPDSQVGWWQVDDGLVLEEGIQGDVLPDADVFNFRQAEVFHRSGYGFSLRVE